MLEQIDISQPWVIAGAALVLVVLVALLLWMHKKMHARHNKSLKDEISELADHAEDAFNQTREVQQKEQDTEEKNVFIQDRRKAQDRRGQQTAAQNTDLLTEYEVYLQFGYLERAAKTLSYYLDTLEEPPSRLQKKLLKLYLLTKQIDEYSYLLEHMYQNKLIGKDNFQQAVVIGLKSDKNNLNLRLMAQTELDWGPEEILFQIGLGNKVKQQFHSTLAKTGNQQNEQLSVLSADLNLSEAHALHESKRKKQPATNTRKNLVNGQVKLEAMQLEPEEKSALKGFVPAKTRAKFFMLDEDYDSATQSFEEALSSEERPLTLLTDLLQIDILTQSPDQFIKHFYAYLQSLGEQGEALKQQMLEKGRSIGPHPFFSEMASAATQKERIQIAQKYLDTHSTESSRFTDEKKPLVMVQNPTTQEDTPPSLQHETDGLSYASLALEEAQARLEYGQIEEAIRTLETALLNRPENETLYLPLLNLYQRLDDHERFAEFAQKLQTKNESVPEKAALAINRLTQLFKNQKIETK